MSAVVLDFISDPLTVCIGTGLTVLLILGRIFLRTFFGHKLNAGDGWLILAHFCNGLRLASDFYIHNHGTPLTHAIGVQKGVTMIDGIPVNLNTTPEEEKTLILAGKLMVAGRIAAVFALYGLKMTILDNLSVYRKRMTGRQWIALLTYSILFLTSVASFVSVFIECRPLALNWKIFPEVGRCNYGATWITTFEISNTVTDGMLLCLLILLVARAPLSGSEKAHMGIFGLGVLFIVLEIIRLVKGMNYADVLQNRIGWRSVEVAVVAFVATIPTILKLLQHGRCGDQDEPPKRSSQQHRRHIAVSPDDIHLAPYNPPYMPRHTGIWDGSGPVPTNSENGAHMSPIQNPTQNSVVSTPVEDRNGDDRPPPRIPYRAPRVNRRPGQRAGPRAGPRTGLGDNNGPHSHLNGWLELDELEPVSRSANMTTPELDDAANGNGILVATEISQEAHRLTNGEGPRIVTIRERTRVNQNGV